MKALNVLLALLVSAIIGLLVFEGGLRLIGKGPKDTLVAFDAQTGWSKKPNYTFRRSTPGYDVTVRTNEHGLNDDSDAGPGKAEGTLRVLALGDSFTQGFSVDRDHLFIDILERWWVDEGRAVEIINAGTEAFDTAQQVAWLESYGKAYEPDLILLFPYQNDLYWNAQTAYQSANGDRDKPRYTADGTLEIGHLTPPEEDSWLERTATAKLFGSGPVVDSEAHHFSVGGDRIHREFAPLLTQEPDFMGPVREHTLGALRAFKRISDELGAKSYVVPIPDASLYAETDVNGRNESVTGMRLGSIAAPWSADRPVDLFLELSSQVGLDTLDPRAYLRGQSDAGKALYFPKNVDWHLNEEGNMALASFLRDELDSLHGVPPAQTAKSAPPAPAEDAGVPFFLKLYGILLTGLTLLYWGTYPEESKWKAPFQVGAMLALVFGIFIGITKLQRMLPPQVAPIFLIVVIGAILGFVIYKLGRRVGTILELVKAFALRGHWYLMPLVVVLLTIGSLLVVAASSPLIAPFIYTLF